MSKRDWRERKSVPRCGATRKRMFKSWEAAMQFYRALGEDCRAEQMRAYQCQFCSSFHLTSQERSYWRARDSR
jgi:hypothetical protein